MNTIREIIYRVRQGESERQISRDLGISRPTIHKYKLMAEGKGFLDVKKAMAEENELLEALAPSLPVLSQKKNVETRRWGVSYVLDRDYRKRCCGGGMRYETGRVGRKLVRGFCCWPVSTCVANGRV
ncbi:MAG: helix-turn-helix domain-containing protein [Anaerolineaceae bacterium]|nr:helix-turn-helix domain-containing protein [Anaerolineaceae bacterium]